jgi:hypothetical protein
MNYTINDSRKVLGETDYESAAREFFGFEMYCAAPANLHGWFPHPTNTFKVSMISLFVHTSTSV